MQLVKEHVNLRKFPNATSTTSGVGLDKTLAVPVIILVLTVEWDVRQKNKVQVQQVNLKPFASKLKSMKLFIH